MFQRFIKKLVHVFGYDLVKYSVKARGLNPYLDMVHYVTNNSPTVFDVGSNLGESLESFKIVFPSAKLYCFEPSLRSFALLKEKYSSHGDVKLYCQALGSTSSTRLFYDNEFPFMSSFLELGAYGYGDVIDKRLISLNTVDNIVNTEKIATVDILKIDTQGFEYDVILGSSNLLNSRSITLIHVELTFTEMYLNLPDYRLIIDYLYDNGFVLCGIYRQHFQNAQLSWADALFARK